jgi:hypothetical protein
MPASLDFFKASPFVSGAEAGVGTFADSITASSTLSILLFGVAAGIFDTFASFVSCNGLRAFGCSINLFSSGSSAGSALASTGAERLGSDAEEDPSIGLGTSAVSMRLGRCVKTLTFFDLGVIEIVEAAIFLLFPCFRQG